MAYPNVYAKELSSSEISSMVGKGMCNVEADEHESTRVIKWEDLVKLRWSETVTDVYIAKCIVQLGSLCEQNKAGRSRAETEQLVS